MALRKTALALVIVAFVAAFVGAPASAGSAADRIVFFKPGVSSARFGAPIISRHGGTAGKHLGLINAYTARLTPESARSLARDPVVLRVDDDIVVFIAVSSSKRPPQPPETLPWGTD